jgi:hypothetical protein
VRPVNRSGLQLVQNIANDIYRENGMEEHYREIDEAGRELEEMNNR